MESAAPGKEQQRDADRTFERHDGDREGKARRVVQAVLRDECVPERFEGMRLEERGGQEGGSTQNEGDRGERLDAGRGLHERERHQK